MVGIKQSPLSRFAGSHMHVFIFELFYPYIGAMSSNFTFIGMIGVFHPSGNLFSPTVIPNCHCNPERSGSW